MSPATNIDASNEDGFLPKVRMIGSRRTMTGRTRPNKEASVPVAIREDCVRYWEAYLRRDRRAAAMRRRLFRKILRHIEAGGESAAAWILLADLHLTNPSAIRCLRKALSLSPNDPEAHAELAACLSAQGARRSAVRFHCEAALRRCGTSDVEEELLYTIYDSASGAGLADMARRAWCLGRRRFPRSPLFRRPMSGTPA